jgi:hypothetical protein
MATAPPECAVTVDDLRQRGWQVSRPSMPVQDSRPPVPTPAHARERYHAYKLPLLERIFSLRQNITQRRVPSAIVNTIMKSRPDRCGTLQATVTTSQLVMQMTKMKTLRRTLVEDGEGRSARHGVAVNVDFLNGGAARDGHLPP